MVSLAPGKSGLGFRPSEMSYSARLGSAAISSAEC